MKDFATLDSKLVESQKAIGQSSNLAQIALTYGYNFDDDKYKMYACILSVIAQVCIDNAKRMFVIDTVAEIKRLEKDMHIVTKEDGEIVADNGYPVFWKLIKKIPYDQEKAFDKKVNMDLVCPMNYLFNVKVDKANKTRTIPMTEFFVKTKIDKNLKRKSLKVEEFLEKYSIDLYEYNSNDKKDIESFLLLEDEFNQMIDDIRQIYVGKSYSALFGWLIDRAFQISNRSKGASNLCNSNLNKNRPMLLKALYKVNPKILLECFAKNITESIDN